jgi:methylaspartate ammonia-lyase
LAKDFIPVIEKHIFPQIIGKELGSFRALSKELEDFTLDGKKLHTAIRYGVSQALLDAVSKAKHKLMCETIAEEYGLTILAKEVPIFTQSGDFRYENADKMIMKEASILPHALINNVEIKLGGKGELLLNYVAWLKERIQKLRLKESYAPIMHIDVYGTIGQVFGNQNYEAIASYLASLAEKAAPFRLRIEGPMDLEDSKKQLSALSTLTRLLDERKIPVEIVADEWCNTLEDIKDFADHRAGNMIQIKTPDLGSIANTVEAVLYCKEKGVGAYQGGTCNETDRSAQVCVHLAMASRPDQILAKPGMGVDEGFMIVYNEMQRIIHLLKLRA